MWQAWRGKNKLNTITQLGTNIKDNLPAVLRPAFEQVLKNRLDYQLIQLAEQLSLHAQALDLAEHKPTLNLVANLDWNKNIANKSKGLFERSASYGLQLKVPLFSGLRVVAQRREWQQTLLQVRTQKQQLERDIFYQLQQAWAGYNALEQQVKLSQTWKKQSLQAWRQALVSHRVGRVGMLQVVQLQSSYQQADNSLLQTEHALRQNQVQLLSAMGEALAPLYGCN